MRKNTLVTPFFFVLVFMALAELIFCFTDGAVFLWSQRIILGVICFSCIQLGIKERFLLNPYVCFFFTPFSLMVYDASVSTRFMTELEPRVYIVAIFSFLAFLGGLHTVTQTINRDEEAFEYQEIVTHSGEYAKIGMLLALIWTAFQVLRNVFHISIPFSSIVVQTIYLAIAFLLKSKRKDAFLLVCIISVYMLTSNFRKTAFLYLFILAILTIMNNKKTNSKTLFVSIVLLGFGGLFMVFFAYPLKMYFAANGSFEGLNGGFDALVRIMEEESVGYGSLGDSVFLLRPYLSMINGWTNLDYVLATQPEPTYGMWFVRPILNILQIDTASMPIFTLYPRSNYYNTFGFLTIQIKDFGYVGAVILTFLEGIFSAQCYKKFREYRNDMIAVTRYVFVSCAIIEMFFSNHFLVGGVHIVYLVSAGIRWFIRKTNAEMYEAMRT